MLSLPLFTYLTRQKSTYTIMSSSTSLFHLIMCPSLRLFSLSLSPFFSLAPKKKSVHKTEQKKNVKGLNLVETFAQEGKKLFTAILQDELREHTHSHTRRRSFFQIFLSFFSMHSSKNEVSLFLLSEAERGKRNKATF